MNKMHEEKSSYIRIMYIFILKGNHIHTFEGQIKTL